MIREILQRLLRKYGGLRVKAIRTLAAKIARVTFYVLKKSTAIQRGQMLRHGADKKHREEIATQTVEGGCSCCVAGGGRPSLGIHHVLCMLMYRIIKPSKTELGGGCSAIENAYPE